jgi:glycosyltransferase involved in cell wall biosynthesis
MSKLSVVIPAFNEARRIEAPLRHLGEYCARHQPDMEILVVDDGSADQTANVVRRVSESMSNLRLIRHETNHGKGYACRTGVMQASGDWVLCMDADMIVPFDQIESMLELGKQHPVVIGSRHVSPAGTGLPNEPSHRRWMGRAFNWLVRSLLVPGVADTQCGLKLYRRDAARALFARSAIAGFAFDVEVLHLAQQLGYSICEAAVAFEHDRRSKVNLLLDPPRMFLDVLKIRLRQQHRRSS